MTKKKRENQFSWFRTDHFIFPKVLFAVVVFFGCANKNENTNEKDEESEMEDDDFEKDYSVLGLAIDGDGTPVRIQLMMGNESSSTDSYGEFSFYHAEPGTAIINTEATDLYAAASVQTEIVEGETSLVTLRVLKKKGYVTISGKDGGIVEIEDDFSAEIPPDAFINNEGEVVSGDIRFSITPVDLSSPSDLQAVPGSMLAEEGGETVPLESYGMAEVDARDDSGELRLADGKTIKLTFPIPEFLSELPDELPFWQFDSSKGLWMNKGSFALEASGDKDGDKYVGEISETGWCNLDVPYDAVCLTGTVVDKEEIAHNGISVTAVGQDYSGTYTDVSDEEGRFFLPVKANAIVTLSVSGLAFSGDPVDIYRIESQSLETEAQGETISLPLDDTQALTCTDIGKLEISMIPIDDLVVEEDVVITSEQDLEAIQDIEFFNGCLEIVDTNIQSISLPNARDIRCLEISKNDKLTSIDLPRLSRCDYSFQIEDNAAIQSLSGFESLTKTGLTSIGGNNSLETIDGFPLLSATGYLTIGSSGILGGSNPLLTTITGFGNLRYPSFLEISNNALLEDLSGFRNVKKTSALYISYNDSLKSLDSLKPLETIDMTLSIHDNKALESISGLKNLTYLGDPEILHSISGNYDDHNVVEIYDNDSLLTCDALDFVESVESLLEDSEKACVQNNADDECDDECEIDP